MIVSLLVLLAVAPFSMACTCHPDWPKPLCAADQVIKVNSNGSCYVTLNDYDPFGIGPVNLDSTNGEDGTTPPIWKCDSWQADRNERLSFRSVSPVRIEGILNKEGDMINSVQTDAYFVTGADSASCGIPLPIGPSFLFLAGGTFDKNRIEGDMCVTTFIMGEDFDAVKRALRQQCATGNTTVPPLDETT